MEPGGGGGGAKRQRVGELDGRREDAIPADDRISALPDELRLLVLTHLPLKDAIRTGALARGWRDQWRSRWAHRASLEVRIRSRDAKQRELLGALEREPRPRRRLERFSLTVWISTFKASELRRFLEYTAERGVEDLHVEARRPTFRFHLPLSCPALARLSLSWIGVSNMYYKGARPFLALVAIRLESVRCARGAFRSMMALCPNLLTLHLHGCRCRAGLEFDRLPPNLRSLTIVDCDRITSLDDIVRVPTLRSFRFWGWLFSFPWSIPRDAALSHLYIRLSGGLLPMEQWNIHNLRKSLPEDLSNLTVLTISYNVLTGASVLPEDDGANNAQLPNFNLHSLKELHLLPIKRNAVSLSSLRMFLKVFQCPNLERLFVQLLSYEWNPMEDCVDEVREEPPEDGLNNLVMVKVMNFKWIPREVQLVSFLLRKASSLQKLLIVSCDVTPVDSPGAPEADLSLLKQALVDGKITLTTSDNAATQPYHEVSIKPWFNHYYG